MKIQEFNDVGIKKLNDLTKEELHQWLEEPYKKCSECVHSTGE